MTLPLCLNCGHGAGQHEPEAVTGRMGQAAGICFGGGRRGERCLCALYTPGDEPDRRPDLL